MVRAPIRARTISGFAIASVLLAAGCGAFGDPGSPKSEERAVTGVTAVELLTSGDLTISTGTTERLTVTAGQNQLPNLTSDVRDGTLVLASTPGLGPSGDIRYDLVLPRLDRLDVAGSGSVRGNGVVRDRLELDLSGSGDTDLGGIAASDVAVVLSGSGDALLSGRAATQRVTISGSGEYDAHDLATEQADVEVSGSGSAQIAVSQRLDASVSGSGDIVYTGSPPQLQQHTSGSGSITKGP